MPLIVPDASVILKWVLRGDDEPDQVAAELIRERWLAEVDSILLPRLWLYEVGNVLGSKRPEYAVSLVELLLDYEFEEVDMDRETCRLTLDLMKASKTSFYDTSYHAVAIMAGGTFVTADLRYYDKARKHGHIKTLEGFF